MHELRIRLELGEQRREFYVAGCVSPTIGDQVGAQAAPAGGSHAGTPALRAYA